MRSFLNRPIDLAQTIDMISSELEILLNSATYGDTGPLRESSSWLYIAGTPPRLLDETFFVSGPADSRIVYLESR